MQNQPNPSLQKIEDLFAQTVEEYLPMVQTISIQTQLIQQLQKDHQRLTKQCHELTSQNKNQKAVEESVREKGKAELKADKQMFLHEALSERQEAYEREFMRKKDQLLEEIFLKYQQICFMTKKKEGTTNLFTHLNDQIFGNRGSKSRPEAKRQSSNK